MTINARETGREDENNQMDQNRGTNSYGSQDNVSARGGSGSQQDENQRKNNFAGSSQQDQGNK